MHWFSTVGLRLPLKNCEKYAFPSISVKQTEIYVKSIGAQALKIMYMQPQGHHFSTLSVR